MILRTKELEKHKIKIGMHVQNLDLEIEFSKLSWAFVHMNRKNKGILILTR